MARNRLITLYKLDAVSRAGFRYGFVALALWQEIGRGGPNSVQDVLYSSSLHFILNFMRCVIWFKVLIFVFIFTVELQLNCPRLQPTHNR